jgi:fluoride ion exporter CrcB/FEX
MADAGDERRRAAAIAIGGAAGAGVRWAVLTAVPGGAFPWPVFAVNVAGSVLLGVVH